MKVLIIDDEGIIRRALNRVLSLFGDSIYEATDGIEGLALWNEINPDLVFLDVIMPNMTGPEMLLNLVNRGNTKIVLMSAYSENIEELLKKEKVDCYIPKPFNNILEVVKNARALCNGDGNLESK